MSEKTVRRMTAVNYLFGIFFNGNDKIIIVLIVSTDAASKIHLFFFYIFL